MFATLRLDEQFAAILNQTDYPLRNIKPNPPKFYP
jgi:hypothetical protein